MPPPTYPPPRPKVRLAKWSDTARMAEIAAEAFDQNDLCGRFMHPHRHQFPADYITFWRQEIRSHLFEPDVYFLVSTVPAEVGADKEGGNVDDEKAAVLVVGVAKWKRQGKTKSPFSSWIHGLSHTFSFPHAPPTPSPSPHLLPKKRRTQPQPPVNGGGKNHSPPPPHPNPYNPHLPPPLAQPRRRPLQSQLLIPRLPFLRPPLVRPARPDLVPRYVVRAPSISESGTRT